MPPHRGRAFRTTRPPNNRRKLIWATTRQATAIAAGATLVQSLTVDLTAAGAAVGLTIMRTHLMMSPVAAPALNDLAGVGLAVVRTGDLGNSVGHRPNVDSDAEIDWMWWQKYFAAPVFNPSGSNIIHIDSRAKRKVDELNTVYALCLTSSAAQTWNIDARVLVALP